MKGFMLKTILEKKYRIGQKVEVRIPRSDVNSTSFSRQTSQKLEIGTIKGDYTYYVLVDFGKSRSCFLKIDIALGKVYFKEV